MTHTRRPPRWFGLSTLALVLSLSACATPSSGSVSSVTIDGGDRTIVVGDALVLTATVATTGSADDAVTWSSSVDAVASIDNDGNVLGLTEGTTDLTATSTADPTKNDAITLTVNAPTPTLVDTTPGVSGIFVGGTADGPELLRTAPDSATFYTELYTDIYDYVEGGARPDFVPATLDGVLWGLNCDEGLEEAFVIDPALTDAWDGGFLGYYDGVFDSGLTFDTGTVREYSDGTLVLSCAATIEPAGMDVTRHVVVPGASAEGRFALDVFAITNTGAGSLDLTPFEYYQDDGADDSSTEPWEDYGTIGAFEWATKDSIDLDDPAVGVVPLPSTAFEVDVASTNGDEYTLMGTGTLAAGATTSFAMLGAVRGGYIAGDAAGKDAAMVALGTELAALDGGVFCAAAADPFFVWTALVEDGATIFDAICEGYAALP